MRRPKTFVLFSFTVIVLLASLFVASNFQYGLHNVLWTIIQIKYAIYTAIGLIVGLIVGFYIGVIYTIKRMEKK